MTLLFFLLLKGTEQSHIRDFTTQSTQMNISKCHDCTSSALHSLSYMDRVSAGSMLHAGSTLCLLSSVREQIDRTQKIQLIFMKKYFQSSITPNHKKECPWHDGHCCAIRHIDASRRPEKLTILSLVLVTWAIQPLQRFPSPSFSVLCFSFNIWLLESRTYTGNMWTWVQSPILCWVNLLKVKGITFQNNMEELFCLTYVFFFSFVFNSWNVNFIDVKSVLENKLVDQSVVLWKPQWIWSENSAATHLAALPNTHIHTSLSVF